MNFCFPLVEQFYSLFSFPLLEKRKLIKKELHQTLFTQTCRLNALAVKLSAEINIENNRGFSLQKLIKGSSWINTELLKSKKLLHKIKAIQKRALEGVDIPSHIESSLKMLIKAKTKKKFPLNIKKGDPALLVPLDSKDKCFMTHTSTYLVDAELGKGGGKTAYKVFNATKGKYQVHLTFNDLAEIKKLRHAQCETQALLTLKKAMRVIKCKEIIQLNKSTSFIVEYANKGSLHSQLSKLKEAEKESVALDILKGLVEMHSCGLIHRDIKPGNILLIQKTPNSGITAKIADFDLSVPPGDTPLSLEVRKSVAGTKGFIAPELFKISPEMPANHRRSAVSKATTKAIDVFSMGMTLYYLFGGKRVFNKGEKREPEQELLLVRQQLENPNTSIRFASAILPMLALNPQDRPTAQQALSHFREVMPDPSP